MSISIIVGRAVMEDTIQKVKAELAKVHADMTAELPLGTDPQSLNRLREVASHASATGATLAIYLRGLTELVKKEEARITLEHIKAGDIQTPKEQHLRALINEQLAGPKSYVSQLETYIDVCRSRVMLIQTMLRGVEKEAIL